MFPLFAIISKDLIVEIVRNSIYTTNNEDDHTLWGECANRIENSGAGRGSVINRTTPSSFDKRSGTSKKH